MSRERKIFTINTGVDLTGVFLPGSDIPMHVEYLTSANGIVMLNLTADANTAPKEYKSGIQDPNFDEDDLRNYPLLYLGENEDKLYYSVWTSANTENFGANTADLGYAEVSMPLSANVSKSMCLPSGTLESRKGALSANAEYANVGITLTTDDITEYYDNEQL